MLDIDISGIKPFFPMTTVAQEGDSEEPVLLSDPTLKEFQ
jgi:hypothetical protein